VRGECETFPDDLAHSRVRTFIEAVDAITAEREKAYNAEFGKTSFSITAFVSCGGTVITLALLDPEPTTKTLLAIVGVFGGATTCIGSLFGKQEAERRGSEAREARSAEELNAEAQFRLLQIQEP
jgi:hypothetical protein